MIEIIYYPVNGDKKAVRVDNVNDGDWEKWLRVAVELLVKEIKS